jgi:hypothetical protein
MCNVPEEYRAALFGVRRKTEEPVGVEEIPVCVDEQLGHDLVHGRPDPARAVRR